MLIKIKDQYIELDESTVLSEADLDLLDQGEVIK
jgi:hypothetical protein